jgi:hypothetical protein
MPHLSKSAIKPQSGSPFPPASLCAFPLVGSSAPPSEEEGGASFVTGQQVERRALAARRGESEMTKSIQKVTLSQSRDIPFNKLVLSQANVRRIKAGVSIEELAEDIARRTLLQSLTVRPVLDDDGAETGMFEVPAGGRRYRALELLVKQKRLARTAPIPSTPTAATPCSRIASRSVSTQCTSRGTGVHAHSLSRSYCGGHRPRCWGRGVVADRRQLSRPCDQGPHSASST